MKVRDLFVVSAFVLGGLAVAYSSDVLEALRAWKYSSPLCIRIEEALADASGKSKVRLKEEIARLEGLLEIEVAAKEQLRESLELSVQELGECDLHIAKLASDLEHSERVRGTQSSELAHCRQLIDAQESVVRETNYRYQALVRRVRDLGRDDALGGLARE